THKINLWFKQILQRLPLETILVQVREGENNLLPCAFFSRALTALEQNYDVFNKELLAINSAFQHWRCFLEEVWFPIEINTDHQNLHTLQQAKPLSPRQMR
ncbi:hypothetical protein E2320_002770, partial [Naja naja]